MQLQIAAAAAWRIQTSDSAFCQTSLNVVIVVCITDEVSGVVVQEHERLHQQLMTAHQSKESERSRLIASLTEGLLLTSLVACCFYCILLLPPPKKDVVSQVFFTRDSRNCYSAS